MDREIKPETKVVRMGPDIPSLGVYLGSVYEVEAYNPKAVDGLKLKGTSERLNAENFEIVSA